MALLSCLKGAGDVQNAVTMQCVPVFIHALGWQERLIFLKQVQFSAASYSFTDMS